MQKVEAPSQTEMMVSYHTGEPMLCCRYRITFAPMTHFIKAQGVSDAFESDIKGYAFVENVLMSRIITVKKCSAVNKEASGLW